MKVGDTVEIPCHYDLWMKGARFGKVTKITDTQIIVKLDLVKKLARIALEDKEFFRVL